MSKKLWVCAVPFAVFVVGSCGGDSGSNGGSELKDAVAQALVNSPDSGDLPFEVDTELAGCMASAVLDDPAMQEKLQAAFDEGKSGEDLLSSTGELGSEEDIMRPMFSCFGSAQIVEFLAAEVEDQSTVTNEKKQCLVDEFDKMGKDTVLDGFLAFSTGDASNDGATKITAATISCFGLESFG